MTYTINSNETKLIKRYKNLIYNLANKIYRDELGIDYEDLIQTGYLILLKAYKKFDKDKGCKFITYAYPSIKRAMWQEINSQQQIISIPRSIMDFSSHLYKAELLYNSEDDIVSYLESNSNLTHRQAKVLYNNKRLSNKVRMGDDIMNEVIGTIDTDLDNELDTKRFIKFIKTQLEYLTIDQRLVIELKYFSEQEYSFVDIARLLNKQPTNIFGLHKNGIKNLRKRVQKLLKERN